jgi:hypothetical protein
MVLRILKWTALGLAAATVVIFLVGWLVMWLWNWLMPDIFGLPVITVCQAWGLLLLAHLLLGGGQSHRHEKQGGHSGSGRGEMSVGIGGFRYHVKKAFRRPRDGGSPPKPSADEAPAG